MAKSKKDINPYDLGSVAKITRPKKKKKVNEWQKFEKKVEKLIMDALKNLDNE